MRNILSKFGDIPSALARQARGGSDSTDKDRNMVAGASSGEKGTAPRVLWAGAKSEPITDGNYGVEQNDPGPNHFGDHKKNQARNAPN